MVSLASLAQPQLYLDIYISVKEPSGLDQEQVKVSEGLKSRPKLSHICWNSARIKMRDIIEKWDKIEKVRQNCK